MVYIMCDFVCGVFAYNQDEGRQKTSAIVEIFTQPNDEPVVPQTDSSLNKENVIAGQ